MRLYAFLDTTTGLVNMAELPSSGAVAGSLKLTYTGKPRALMLLPLAAGIVGVPPATVSGQATYSPQVGQCIAGLDSTEVAALTETAGDHLLTLSFDDLGGCAGDFLLTKYPKLTSLSLPVFLACARSFAPTYMPLLTTLNHPSLLWCRDYKPSYMDILATLSAASLAHVANDFAPISLGAVTTWYFPVLANVGGSFMPTSLYNLASMPIPSLWHVGGIFAPTGINAMTSWTIPALTDVDDLFCPSGFPSLVSLSAPVLARTAGVTISYMPAMTTLSLAGLVSCPGSIDMHTGNGNLTNVTLGTIGTLKSMNTVGATSIRLDGQKLTAASVNAILALLVSLDGTNGTTYWGSRTLMMNGGTSSPPTGQGITDAATLTARYSSIITN